MVALHDAAKIAEIPFPFPYAQICTFLLLTHWALTPLVTLQWTTSVVWAFVFSFVQVFIFWCLNLTAIELEQPFGRDANDLQTVDMQKILNQQLLLLLDTRNGDPPDLEKGFKDEIVGEARRCSMISSISSTCEAGNLPRAL
ncbi:unnamed protein product [Prorocentrum cordatum]|uniref:Bestrophin homolog n=1 Tax=Prorocentrum cordatum TaxID=2364126 RepID=A0ABN9S5M0_9DINO|nr:unnamed protein product [Polarella glacialis]